MTSDSKDIVNLIGRQKNKSTDLMNIPVFIYKILAYIIFHTVSMLFNNSLSEGIFPEGFKTAKIIQIFKYCDSNSTADYRPISMVPFLSKMFEKLMRARLYSYLKSNNILCKNVLGFCKNFNTSDAIIEFLDYVYSSLDKTRAPLLDIQITQDRIRHSSRRIRPARGRVGRVTDSGSNPRARFLLLEQKPVLYHEWSGMVETNALYR